MLVFYKPAALCACTCMRTNSCAYVLHERLDVKQLNDASILIYIPWLPELCLKLPHLMNNSAPSDGAAERGKGSRIQVQLFTQYLNVHGFILTTVCFCSPMNSFTSTVSKSERSQSWASLQTHRIDSLKQTDHTGCKTKREIYFAISICYMTFEDAQCQSSFLNVNPPTCPAHFIQHIPAGTEQISRDGWFLHYCWFCSETPYVSTLGER